MLRRLISSRASADHTRCRVAGSSWGGIFKCNFYAKRVRRPATKWSDNGSWPLVYLQNFSPNFWLQKHPTNHWTVHPFLLDLPPFIYIVGAMSLSSIQIVSLKSNWTPGQLTRSKLYNTLFIGEWGFLGTEQERYKGISSMSACLHHLLVLVFVVYVKAAL